MNSSREQNEWFAAALAMLLLALTGSLAAPALPPRAKDFVDLRPAFTNYGLPLRLQGSRGTCSVFTIAGAMEYALARQGRRDTPLSVEFLNWASNRAVTNSHDGGFFSDLWSGFAAYGICAERDMPYLRRFDPNLCPSDAAFQGARETWKASLKLAWIKRWDVRTGLSPAQLAEMKRVLAEGWPVCAGMRWPKNEGWNNGVLQMAPPQEVFDGHSVLLVGYREDTEAPSCGVVLVRNSGKGVNDAAITFEYLSAYVNDALWISSLKGAEPSK